MQLLRVGILIVRGFERRRRLAWQDSDEGERIDFICSSVIIILEMLNCKGQLGSSLAR